ncbi:MAG: glycosyltransferase family 4 protein [Clostridiales bacterium]|nr:glycosyltransferase family 4 protein [Clostridiales bacterium]
MIKVMEVSSDTNIGGAGKCVLTLLKHFDYDTFEVKAVLPKNSRLKPEIEAMNIPVIEAEGIADTSLSKEGIRSLEEIFKEEKPDIVHAHGSMSARIAARRAGARVVFTRHSVFEPSKKLSRGLGKLINGVINNYYADRIIAVAEAAKDNLTATGVSEKKIDVILNGVEGLCEVSEDEKKELRQRFGVLPGEKVVSIVARLEDIKGHEYFIDAACELLKAGVRARFFIAGTGSYEDTLKDKVKKSGYDDRIIFTGFLKDADKLMAITDVQVNASYGTEATSLALLEGMSIGIPAVVSDFGGNPGVIKSGKNGYVVKKCDSHAIAVRVKELLTDEEAYKRLSKGAREMFKDSFTAEAMTRNTERIYKSL